MRLCGVSDEVEQHYGRVKEVLNTVHAKIGNATIELKKCSNPHKHAR
jgi:hypothetical protein